MDIIKWEVSLKIKVGKLDFIVKFSEFIQIITDRKKFEISGNESAKISGSFPDCFKSFVLDCLKLVDVCFTSITTYRSSIQEDGVAVISI